MTDLAGEYGRQGIRRDPGRQADFNFTQSRLLVLISAIMVLSVGRWIKSDVRVPVGLPERFSDTPATARTACGINRQHAIYGRGKPAFSISFRSFPVPPAGVDIPIRGFQFSFGLDQVSGGFDAGALNAGQSVPRRW